MENKGILGAIRYRISKSEMQKDVSLEKTEHEHTKVGLKEALEKEKAEPKSSGNEAKLKAEIARSYSVKTTYEQRRANLFKYIRVDDCCLNRIIQLHRNTNRRSNSIRTSSTFRFRTRTELCKKEFLLKQI